VEKDSEDWVSACRSFEVNGVQDRGRGKNTWNECVKKDLVELGLHREYALNCYAETVQPRASMDSGR